MAIIKTSTTTEYLSNPSHLLQPFSKLHILLQAGCWCCSDDTDSAQSCWCDCNLNSISGLLENRTDKFIGKQQRIWRKSNQKTTCKNVKSYSSSRLLRPLKTEQLASPPLPTWHLEQRISKICRKLKKVHKNRGIKSEYSWSLLL